MTTDAGAEWGATKPEADLVACLSELAEGIWVITTASGASYVLDLEKRTCTRVLGRLVGRPADRALLRRDGEPVRLVGVARCDIGAPMRLLVQDRPDRLTYRTTTPVVRIERA